MDFMKSIKLLILISESIMMKSRNNRILGGEKNEDKQDRAKPGSELHGKKFLSDPLHEN